MKVITTSPFYTPLRLTAGLDPQSSAYTKTLAALPQNNQHVQIPNSGENRSSHKYEDLRDDDYDLRLFVFTPSVKDNDPIIQFHIYGNGVSVVTVEFDCANTTTAEELEQYSQDITRNTFSAHVQALKSLLDQVYIKLPKVMMEDGLVMGEIRHQDICWISRAVILDSNALKNTITKTFVIDWLKNTARPDDAQKLINGTISESMTWLNHLIVDPDTDHRALLFSALRIAQYFYASQEKLNSNAYHALTNSTLEKNVRLVEKNLIEARRRMQMLHIMYEIQKVFLNRRKRQLLDGLMDVWEYDTLKANGDRMVSASDTRITEITNRRSDRSSFFTDLILVGLALVTVIEVSIYLTEYSREVMSRPALAYQDDRVSWILSTIAAIDTDQMLIGGSFIILILVCFYVYWKIKR